jgi:prepilin-type N-terminal cleavage/methylation domain-containing protein
MKSNASSTGFTLIEMLVVTGIMAILALIMMAGYAGYSATATTTEVTSDAKTLNRAVTVYQTTGGTIAGGAAAADVLADLQATYSSNITHETLAASEIIGRDVALTPYTADDGSARLQWNGTAFVVATTGPGYRMTRSNVTTLSTQSRTVSGQHFSSQTDGTTTSGWIWGYAAPSATSTTALTGNLLSPPTFLYAGIIPASSFPLTSWLEPPTSPGNPTGTTYVYSTSGTPSTGSSSDWATRIWNLSDFPTTIEAMAVQGNDTSTVATAQWLAQSDLAFSRELGGSSPNVLPSDLVLGSTENGFVLTLTANTSGYYALQYTVDGSDPSTSPTARVATNATPFYLLSSDFIAGPIEFKGVGVPTSAEVNRFVNTRIIDLRLIPIQGNLTGMRWVTPGASPVQADSTTTYTSDASAQYINVTRSDGANTTTSTQVSNTTGSF